MAKTIIGVMGPGKTSKDIRDSAKELGRLISKNNWVLLTGGRKVGVMEAASEGANRAGGTVLGILPGESKSEASKFVDIAICTGMGGARNNINVLSSDVVIACGMGAGTGSEIMLALKAEKPLILLHASESLISFLSELPYSMPRIVAEPKEAIIAIQNYL